MIAARMCPRVLPGRDALLVLTIHASAVVLSVYMRDEGYWTGVHSEWANNSDEVECRQVVDYE